MIVLDAFGRYKSNKIYSTMNNWALSEIGPWTGFCVDFEELISHLSKITHEYPWVIIFNIDGVKVTPIRQLSYGRHPTENINERIKIYQFLLEQALKQSKSKLKAILPISVVDDDPLPLDFPVLSFQKKLNDKSILVPDPDFFYYNYYENVSDKDTIQFNNKCEKAVFIGSSSGRLQITLNDLQERSVPRIESAQYFKSWIHARSATLLS